MIKPGMVICGPRSYFLDDVHATCACGAAIVHRPYVPADYVKACIPCGLAAVRVAEMAGAPFRRTISQRAIDEVRAHFATRPAGGRLS